MGYEIGFCVNYWMPKSGHCNLGTSYNESSEDLGTRIDASELLEQLQLLSHSTFSEDLVLNMFESNREDEEEDRADQLRSRVMDSEAFVPLNQFLPLFEAREEESELEWHLEHIGPKRNLTTQLKAMLGSFLYFPGTPIYSTYQVCT